MDTITDWSDGKGKASDRKDRKKQELRKAGIVTTRIQQQSRCTTFRRSEAEGQEQRGRSGAARGCRPGRKHRREGSEGRNLESVVVRDLMAEALHQSVVVRDQPLIRCGCWTLFYPPFSPAYVTSLGA